MGESGNSSGSVDVRRSSRLLKKQIDGLMKTLSLVDESEEIEMEEDEEEWAPRAGKSGAGRVMAKRGERETSATSSSQRRTNRNHAEVRERCASAALGTTSAPGSIKPISG